MVPFVSNLTKLSLGVVFCGGLAASAFGQEITLKYATGAPAAHYLEAQGGKPFIDRVVELTKGKVKFEYYPAGQVGKPEKMADLAESGVVDIAAWASAYVTNSMPLVGLFELPGINIGACDVSRVYRKLSAPGSALHQTDLSNKGYRFLFSAGPANNEISGKGKPIDSPDGFKGLKIRAAGGVIAGVVTALGGAPVRTSSPETYEAYSRGTVDAILIPWPSFVDYNLDSLSTYTSSGLGFGSGLYLWGINKASWEKLPADVKAAIEQAAMEVEDSLCKWTEKQIVDIGVKLKAAGMKIVEIDAASKAKFDTALAPYVSSWAKSLDDRRLPGSKGLEEFRAALASAGKTQ